MIYIISWLLVSVMFFAVGEYFSKAWALHPSYKTALTLVTMYVLGTLAWLPAIYRGQIISVVGTIWSLMSLLMTLFVGVALYHESLSHIQMVGIGLAFIAIILLSI